MKKSTKYGLQSLPTLATKSEDSKTASLQALKRGGGVAVRGRFDSTTLQLGGRSYIMETYNIPDEEVSIWIRPS